MHTNDLQHHTSSFFLNPNSDRLFTEFYLNKNQVSFPVGGKRRLYSNTLPSYDYESNKLNLTLLKI